MPTSPWRPWLILSVFALLLSVLVLFATLTVTVDGEAVEARLGVGLFRSRLPLAEVVDTLSRRRPDLHVVVTGRNAKPELIAAADLVTEMGQIKHHFAAGVKAQEGIEF